MTRLLIADDEPLVCVGLRSLLKWEDFGVEIAGTARNGQQAAEMIEALRPEIVITDIKMPLKTGLELAEECGRKYGRIPLFIILTSFEDFAFARRALAFQAVDYLVKLELSPESLAAALTRALETLEQIRRETSPLPSPETGTGTEGRGPIQEPRETFFLRLINKLFESREQFSARKTELGLDLSGSAWIALAGEIEEREKDPALRAAPGTAAGEKLRVLYAGAVQMVREKLEKRFPCYITPLAPRRFAVIFCLDDPSPGAPRKILEEELRKTLDMVRDYFNVRLRMALGFPVEDPLRLDESYRAARQALEEPGGEDPLRFFERQCYQQQTVARVQDYIRHRLDKRLSLRETAEVFNISPNYLSHLFTKYAGEGFVEYITGERIRAAREMLIRGEGPVYEIAGRLGYESAFYFSKVFKKVEGLSPREFLRRLEDEKAEDNPLPL